MATSISQLKSIRQNSVDLLNAVKILAEEEGKTPSEAKVLALTAFNRLRQAGRSSFAQSVRAILRHTAKGGDYKPSLYDRLMADRQPSKIPDLTLVDEQYYFVLCKCHDDRRVY